MQVSEFAREGKEYGISLRRAFHKNPELGGREFETAARIEQELDQMGIEHCRVGSTNVVGVIHGTGGKQTVALRADIDALPVQEENDVEYRSCKDGVMHACGHDGHAAALLSAARILVQMKDALPGTVKLLFQSGEENATGAREIVDSGMIDDVNAVFGIHVWNDVEHGKVYISGGEQMASPIEFRVSLKGVGGHGSASHQAVDTTVPLASLVMNLQTIVSMEFDPLTDVVLTVSRMYSGPNAYLKPGEIYNVVSGEAYMEGTVRVFNERDSQLFEEKLRRMVEGTEKLYGVKGSLYYRPHSPMVINDEGLASIAERACVELWGEDSLDHTLGKVMAGEDFGFYREKAPSMFAFVGGRNEEKCPYYPHHNSRFNIDEDAIEQAASLYAQFALDFLKEKAEQLGNREEKNHE